MKKILVTSLILFWFAQMHSADTTAFDIGKYLKDLPETPQELYDKIKRLSKNDEFNITSGEGTHRFNSPRHNSKAKTLSSETEKDFRMCCSDDRSRYKNRQVVQNDKDHTYVTASMLANYMKICEVIKAHKLLQVHVEKTYLFRLDQNNPSFDDTNCVIMQEVSLGTRIANKKDQDLEKLLPTMLTLIEHADIWYPEKSFKIVQNNQELEHQELELMVSAWMLPASYGNFWAMSRDREKLFTVGCDNLCNYFNIRDDHELADEVRKFQTKHDKGIKLKIISNLQNISTKTSFTGV